MRDSICILNGFLVVPGKAEDASKAMATSIQAELMRLGFVLDKQAFNKVSCAPKEWLSHFYGTVIPDLRARMGDASTYVPFYRNFPTQVMEASRVELFLNALVHYWTDGKWEPSQEISRRGMAYEDVEFKAIRLGTEEEFLGIFTRLAGANQALTPQDRATLEWFIDNHRDDIKVPTSVPFKETLCILVAKGLPVLVTSPTDVLRVAVFMSGGDVSLSNVPKAPPSIFYRYRGEASPKDKFRKFSRPERRMILGLLETTGCDPEEMQRHLGKWLRLGEILHVGEYAEKFPLAFAAFKRLRNQPPKVRTFNSRIDMAFAESWKDGVHALKARPGEFARRLDWMLRTFNEKAQVRHILGSFRKLGNGISNKVLFELYRHFEGRSREGHQRMVMLKGSRAKCKTLDPLPPLDKGLVETVHGAISSMIEERIGKLPRLGDVWVDERLKDVPVPFSMRSMNASVKTYVRGTKVPFRKDAKVIRAFLHWNDERGHVDLDLSADFRSESLAGVSHISFTNLKDEVTKSCHSGDIRHRRGACAEYIDVDIKHSLAAGVRYVVLQAYNYDGQPFHKVKEAVFGIMEREFPESNKTFVPSTISNCAAIANDGSSIIVCILDLSEGCYIWADIEADRHLSILENMGGKSCDVVKALVSKPTMSVYDLLSMHARGRGKLVKDRSQADLALGWEEFSSDYAKVLEYMKI